MDQGRNSGRKNKEAAEQKETFHGRKWPSWGLDTIKGLVNKRNLIKGPKFSKQATGSSHVFICSIFRVKGWGVKLGLG